MSMAMRLAAMSTRSKQVTRSWAPAGHVGREVAGIDVGDGGDEGRAEQRQRGAHTAPRPELLTVGGHGSAASWSLLIGRMRVELITVAKAGQWCAERIRPSAMRAEAAHRTGPAVDGQHDPGARRARRGGGSAALSRSETGRTREAGAEGHGVQAEAPARRARRAAAGWGHRCGSWVGWPSAASMRSSNRSDSTCSSTSASACTSSHGTSRTWREERLHQPVPSHDAQRRAPARAGEPQLRGPRCRRARPPAGA